MLYGHAKDFTVFIIIIGAHLLCCSPAPILFELRSQETLSWTRCLFAPSMSFVPRRCIHATLNIMFLVTNDPSGSCIVTLNAVFLFAKDARGSYIVTSKAGIPVGLCYALHTCYVQVYRSHKSNKMLRGVLLVDENRSVMKSHRRGYCLKRKGSVGRDCVQRKAKRN
jgi:hypothetical protein